MIDWAKIAEREMDIRAWLEENHPEVSEDQKHLDEGTVARAYWHHGYMMALQDILRKAAN